MGDKSFSIERQSSFNLAEQLTRELGVTQEEKTSANDLVDWLEQHGIPLSESQIDAHRFVAGVWPADPRDEFEKISPFSWLAPFFDESRREQWTRLVSTLDLDKTALAPGAKSVFLAMQAGCGLELHCEGDDAAIAFADWKTFIDAHKEIGGSRRGRVTAHLPFAWMKAIPGENDLIEKVGGALGLNLAVGDDREALEFIFGIERGMKLPAAGEHFYNFEMFFLSGHLDQKIMQQLALKFPHPDKRVDMAQKLRGISAKYAKYIYEGQIAQMKQDFGITEYTFHPGPLGGWLKPEEFEFFKTNLAEVLQFTTTQGVRLQIESQALSTQQWVELFNDQRFIAYRDRQALGVTVDLVHIEGERQKFTCLQENPQLAVEFGVSAEEFGARPDMNFWFAKMDESWVKEFHLTASAPTTMEGMVNSKGAVLDNHLQIADQRGIVPWFAETLEYVSAFNLAREKKDWIILVQEATLDLEDLQKCKAILETKNPV